MGGEFHITGENGKEITLKGHEPEEYKEVYEMLRGENKTERISELEDRHQSDRITINQLHTALDVMTEKYQRLREINGL